MQHSTPLTYARAKHMRREPTDAERKLWGGLRDRRLGGIKFYRQVPIGPYIVDFVCKELGVVVEVDGVTHGDGDEVRRDERRTLYLQSQGLIVHRVDNMSVYSDIGSALDGILAVVAERVAKGPHPARWATFPRGEGKV